MKRRDFFKGVSGLIGGLSLFGMGKVKADVKPPTAVDMAELRKQKPMYLISWGNDPMLIPREPKGYRKIHRLRNISVPKDLKMNDVQKIIVKCLNEQTR